MTGIVIATSSDEEIKPPFPYMKYAIKFSKCIYMWPNTNKVNRCRYHLTVWFVIVNCCLMVLTFIIKIVREFKNMDSVTELVDFTTVLISSTFRYCYIYFRGEKYLKLVHLIHTKFIHYPFLQTKNPVSLDKHYKLAVRIIMWYSIFTIFWIVQVCFVPIISYEWAIQTRKNASESIVFPMVLDVYAPFESGVQPHSALFYAYQVVWFLTFGLIYVIVDSFWYLVIFLTIGQFALIKHSINEITGILRKEETEERSYWGKHELTEINNELKRCIKHHQFVKEFVHLLDNILNPNILVDTMHAVISIAFMLLDATIALNKNNWRRVMYCLEYFITSIVHMFFFDWLGNELAEKEQEIGEAVYKIPWYQCPSLTPTLVLISIQSRRPHRLTGGNMYKLSLRFFTSTVKAVFSYFTFLLQMRNN